ncbi:MAG: hypothetical protein Q9227_005536 [Pyrenula ochraceoflavens]
MPTSSQTAFLFIDVQKSLISDPSFPYSTPTSLSLWKSIIDSALTSPAKPHIYFVQHNEDDDPTMKYGSEGWQLAIPPPDGVPVLHKTEGDTFVSNPGLAEELRGKEVKRLVLAGMQSENCVGSTAEGGLAAGFEVVLIGNGGHRTWDSGGKKAGEIEAKVEKELEEKGVKVVKWQGGEGFVW